MSYEVELKFPLADKERIVEFLAELQARPEAQQFQCDRYFAHPARDFAQTNEAFRIRQSGDNTKLTYKGPMLDKATKTRREIELSLAEGRQTAEDMAEMLRLLGFSEVRAVRKTRKPYHLDWQGFAIEVTLDHVEELGEFLEIEVVVDDADRTNAQTAILALAQHWNLEHAERRSYLTLLLENDSKR
jgi:adenylate cyclase, class 2